ncbi:MAG TPA: hypothetical protein VI957_02695 [Candidatus Paceibacterota bacterium]
MKNSASSQKQKGFIALPVLIAILLSVLVLGGGAYFVVQRQPPPQSVTVKLENKVLDEDNANTPKEDKTITGHYRFAQDMTGFPDVFSTESAVYYFDNDANSMFGVAGVSSPGDSCSIGIDDAVVQVNNVRSTTYTGPSTSRPAYKATLQRIASEGKLYTSCVEGSGSKKRYCTNADASIVVQMPSLNIQTGQLLRMTWQAPSVYRDGETASIYLMPADNSQKGVWSIAESISLADGTVEWTVPDYISSGAYKVAIQFLGRACSDWRSGRFSQTIESGTFNVASNYVAPKLALPTTGTVYRMGDILRVNWSRGAVPGDKINIILKPRNKFDSKSINADLLVGSMSYEWTVDLSKGNVLPPLPPGEHELTVRLETFKDGYRILDEKTTTVQIVQ